jgi:hypothetical protein
MVTRLSPGIRRGGHPRRDCWNSPMPILCGAMWTRAAMLGLVGWFCSVGWSQTDPQVQPGTQPATAPAPAGDPCADLRHFERESDPAKRDKQIKMLFRCLWNQTDALDTAEARLALWREYLTIQKKHLLRRMPQADPAELDLQIKDIDEHVKRLREEIASVAAERMQLVGEHGALLLSLQMDELDAKLADLEEQIALLEESRDRVQRARQAIAAGKQTPSSRIQAQLDRFDLELRRLRAKRTDYTRERFRTKDKLDALKPPK